MTQPGSSQGGEAITASPSAARRIAELNEARENANAATLRAEGMRDHWIRLFNRLESAVSHHKKNKSAMFVDEVDEALYAARDKILGTAASTERAAVDDPAWVLARYREAKEIIEECWELEMPQDLRQQLDDFFTATGGTT